MRILLHIIIALMITFVGSGDAQQFYKSEGLRLFNQGEYRVAIDSMAAWAGVHTAETGIAYYYIGQSYYNLGLNELNPSRSESYLRQSIDFFDRAVKQADLVSVHSDKVGEARSKMAWCHYRLAELESNPLSSLGTAFQGFIEVSASNSDSLSHIALYMAGECRLREADWKRIQMYLVSNEEAAVDLAQESMRALREAGQTFQRLANTRSATSRLRNCALLRYQDVLYNKAKFYQRMSVTVFNRIDDPEKEGTPVETAVQLLLQIDYNSIFDNMDQQTKVEFRPVIDYQKAVVYLNIYQLINENQNKQLLNAALDSLRWPGFRNEKRFLQANRDQMDPIEAETFLTLTDPDRSLYIQAAQDIPEAWYWMGWSQFITNVERGENPFQKFLDLTENLAVNSRLAVLREDAQYRIFLRRFDQNAANSSTLTDLMRMIEAFRPRNPLVQQRKELLFQLVRVGLGERIWGRILQAPADADRFRDAFILIRNMMVRATRVTGRERVPYLNYLDNLFQITEERRTQETTFYRGLSQFLRAEIQETEDKKREFYMSAGDLLKQVSGDYESEGKYIQARSYFAAAKHESNTRRRENLHEQAKPIFIELINGSRSLRSVYYLGEIFRIRGNGSAARRCYEVVMRKTKGEVGGSFWYGNALAGLQSSGSSGSADELNNIRIADVVFPESLLVVDGEEISLERFADPDYIRRQYWEEARDMLMKFGLPKRSLYPSTFRQAGSHFGHRAFGIVTAGIQERLGAISSGLKLVVILPEGVPQNLTVTLDGVPLTNTGPGIFEKTPLSINQMVEIRVANDLCYPYIQAHRLTKPGVEQVVVTLTREISFQKRGEGIEAGVNVAYFSERLDGNIVIHSSGSGLSSSTFLYRDFQNDITNRDFIYSPVQEGYLVVNSESENLQLYRNDPMVSKEGELALVFTGDDAGLSSPEGIAIDRQGRIYVVDWGNHRICVFGRDGAYLRSLGSLGTNTHQNIGKSVRLVFPTRIAIAEDAQGIALEGGRYDRSPQIYVADRHGIHLMDADGNYLDSIISTPVMAGAYYGLAVRGYGSNVRLYAVNRKTGKIERFVAEPRDSE